MESKCSHFGRGIDHKGGERTARQPTNARKRTGSSRHGSEERGGPQRATGRAGRLRNALQGDLAFTGLLEQLRTWKILKGAELIKGTPSPVSVQERVDSAGLGRLNPESAKENSSP